MSKRKKKFSFRLKKHIILRLYTNNLLLDIKNKLLSVNF